MLNIKTTALPLLIALAASPMAIAEFYLGGKLGNVEWEDGNQAESFDFLVGYQFSEFWAGEVAYTHLGDFDTQQFNTKIEGASYSLVGLLPLDDTFTLKASVGYFDYSVDLTNRGQNFLEAQDGDFIYSLGVNMYLADNTTLSLEYRAIPLHFDLHYKNSSNSSNLQNQSETADNLCLGINLYF